MYDVTSVGLKVAPTLEASADKELFGFGPLCCEAGFGFESASRLKAALVELAKLGKVGFTPFGTRRRI